MPQKNLVLLIATAMVSLASYHVAAHNRYAVTFAETMSLVRDKYVDEVDQQQLFNGAMKGLAEQLDDYSSYLPKQASDTFQEQLNQEFGGVGVLVDLKTSAPNILVRAPLFGSPASEAGILPDDVIVAIDGVAANSISDPTHKMRGPAGSPVKLTIKRESSPDPLELVVKRGRIGIENVKGDTMTSDGRWDYRLASNPEIGYVRLDEFGEKTADSLEKAFESYEKAEPKVKALIFDLRQNPGGLLDQAKEICDMFLDAGRIVTTKGRGGKVEKTMEASAGVIFPRSIPIVVLVDGQSASASEIVAACLQDHGRAKVCGERTWGKGSVQNVVPLGGDRGAIRLTTATFWRPSEKNMQKKRNDGEDADWGVRPDPELAAPITDDQTAAWITDRERRDTSELRRIAFAKAGLPYTEEKRGDTSKEGSKPETTGPVDPALARASEYLEKEIQK
jgi:carboxyl-terminal processing protease